MYYWQAHYFLLIFMYLQLMGVAPDKPPLSVKGTFAWLLINLRGGYRSRWLISRYGHHRHAFLSLSGNASNMRMPCAITESKPGELPTLKRFADFHHCHLHNMLCQHWYTGCSGLCGAGCIKPGSGVCIQWTEPSAPGAVRVSVCPIFVWK